MKLDKGKSNRQKSRRNYSIKVTLGNYHISRLVWAYRKEIIECLNHVKSIKNLHAILVKSKVLKSVVLDPLRENLSVLEPLMECYLAGRDGKSFDTVFNIGDGQLYDLLVEIREFIQEFPPRLEKFYQNYSSDRQRLLEKSPICKICNEHGARMHYANAIIHERCLEKVKARYCEYCGSLYLSHEEKCTNKLECAKYLLKDAIATKTGSDDFVSMNIPLEMLNKAKQTIKEGSSHYKGRN